MYGTHKIKDCRKCGVVLVVGENFTEGRRKGYVWTCTTCTSAESAHHYKKNPEPARRAHRAWSKRNPEVGRFHTMKRHAAKLQRTPSWSDMDAIQLIYENAPKNYDVDHIIPLQGGFVSGLHVPENLQYMYHTLNSSKSNKFEVD